MKTRLVSPTTGMLILLTEELIRTVREQQLERTWICRSCGKLTQYWSVCSSCEDIYGGDTNPDE